MTGSDQTDNFNFEDFERKLKPELFRLDCPSPLWLGDYYFKLLPHDLHQEIMHHLESCPHCREEYDYMKEFIKNPAGKSSADEPDEHSVCKIIPFRHQTQYEEIPLQAANLRSDTEIRGCRKVIFKLDKNDSLALFYDITYGKTDYTFTGQFIPDEQTEEMIAGSLVEIWQDNAIITTCRVDDLCTFHFQLKALLPVIIRVSSQDGTLLSAQLELQKPE